MAELLYPPLYNALQKSLASQLDEGVTSQMVLNNTTGIENKPGVCLVGRINADNSVNSSSQWEWIGYSGVSGNALVGLTRGLAGSTDQDHAVNSIVEFVPDVTLFRALLDCFTTEHNQDGTHGAITATSVSTDTISEKTSNTGVTVDGVLLKDNEVSTDKINEKTSGAGVTVDGVLLKDSEVSTDTISEKTTNTGVTIDGVLLKDGQIPTHLAYSDTRFKMGVFTRDASASAGSVSYTGVGFTPKAIIFFSHVVGSKKVAWGFSTGGSSTLNYGVFQDASGNLQSPNDTWVVGAVDSWGTTEQIGTVTSFNSDGFTISWIKDGSPTGTIKVVYLAFR